MCFFSELYRGLIKKYSKKLLTNYLQKSFFIADTLKIRFLQCAVAGSALDWYYSYYVYTILWTGIILTMFTLLLNTCYAVITI